MQFKIRVPQNWENMSLEERREYIKEQLNNFSGGIYYKASACTAIYNRSGRITHIEIKI